MNKQLLINGGIFVAGAGLGYGAGYLVYKKKYQRLAEEEIESVREAYSKNAKPKPDLADLAKEQISKEAPSAESIMAEAGYTSNNETDAAAFQKANGRVPTIQELILMGDGVPPTEAVINRNRFDHDDDNVAEADILNGNLFDNLPDQDPEDAGAGEQVPSPRSPDRPYLIETSEWYLNETNYDQVALTYWADDEVLVDDGGRVINDFDTMVGATNLHRFGFMSGDPDIVYVRNEKLKTDFEITKDERGYSEVVHHIAPEDDTNGAPRRMRSDDE